jgi:hypothetical protein
MKIYDRAYFAVWLGAPFAIQVTPMIAKPSERPQIP